MSYHIKLKDYNCPKCDALYIPYEKNLSCPSCKVIPIGISGEYLKFIDELIISLRVNKLSCGEYLPGAWYSGSFSESIQPVFFKIFYILSKKKLSSGELFINEYFIKCEPEDKKDEYLRDYFKSIALKIYSRKKELNVGLCNRLISIASRLNPFKKFTIQKKNYETEKTSEHSVESELDKETQARILEEIKRALKE